VDKYASLLPGTILQASDGTRIGTVVQVTAPNDGNRDQDGQLIVRATDGQRHYRIPLLLVQEVWQDTVPTVARLALGPEQLAGYEAAAMGGGAPLEVDPLTIQLLAEDLVATTQPIVRGTLRIHKRVATEPQSVTVPLSVEVAVVEHIPVDRYDPSVPAGPDEVILPVLEEQIVIQKRQVIKEYIRVRKTRVTEEQTVTEMVRREYVEVTERRANGPGPAATVPLVEYASQEPSLPR
jgi:uncharacterized protein (TIGR02271 family)